MSHSHDEHGHEKSHAGESGHEQSEELGHGHERHWGDYNAQPLSPSTLPSISGPALAVFAVALAAILAAITYSSFVLGGRQPETHQQEEK